MELAVAAPKGSWKSWTMSGCSLLHFQEFVSELLPRCDDWTLLGRELVYRDWLTAFQAQRLLQGRGRELILGSYVLLEPIGEGGMGCVYRSRNWKLGTSAPSK